MNWSDPNQLVYTRNTSATQMYLQEKLAAAVDIINDLEQALKKCGL